MALFQKRYGICVGVTLCCLSYQAYAQTVITVDGNDVSSDTAGIIISSAVVPPDAGTISSCTVTYPEIIDFDNLVEGTNQRDLSVSYACEGGAGFFLDLSPMVCTIDLCSTGESSQVAELYSELDSGADPVVVTHVLNSVPYFYSPNNSEDISGDITFDLTASVPSNVPNGSVTGTLTLAFVYN